MSKEAKKYIDQKLNESIANPNTIELTPNDEFEGTVYWFSVTDENGIEATGSVQINPHDLSRNSQDEVEWDKDMPDNWEELEESIIDKAYEMFHSQK